MVNKHIININESARVALRKLSSMPDNSSLTLFVIDQDELLKGTTTHMINVLDKFKSGEINIILLNTQYAGSTSRA